MKIYRILIFMFGFLVSLPHLSFALTQQQVDDAQEAINTTIDIAQNMLQFQSIPAESLDLVEATRYTIGSISLNNLEAVPEVAQLIISLAQDKNDLDALRNGNLEKGSVFYKAAKDIWDLSFFLLGSHGLDLTQTGLLTPIGAANAVIGYQFFMTTAILDMQLSIAKQAISAVTGAMEVKTRVMNRNPYFSNTEKAILNDFCINVSEYPYQEGMDILREQAGIDIYIPKELYDVIDITVPYSSFWGPVDRNWVVAADAKVTEEGDGVKYLQVAYWAYTPDACGYQLPDVQVEFYIDNAWTYVTNGLWGCQTGVAQNDTLYGPKCAETLRIPLPPFTKLPSAVRTVWTFPGDANSIDIPFVILGFPHISLVSAHLRNGILSRTADASCRVSFPVTLSADDDVSGLSWTLTPFNTTTSPPVYVNLAGSDKSFNGFPATLSAGQPIEAMLELQFPVDAPEEVFCATLMIESLNGSPTNFLVRVDLSTDTVGPTPDPMAWESPPAALGYNTVTMIAATALDETGVEYYFEETTGHPGGSDSGWQESPVYTDTELNPGEAYSYRVKARDKTASANETAFSSTTLVKNDMNGYTRLWTRIWGSTVLDRGWDVTVDAAGNLYVVGRTEGSFDGQTNNGSRDFCLTKFNSSGTKQWTRIWGSTLSFSFDAGVTVDAAGNIYVAGYTWGSFDGQTNNGDYDFCLTKFNSSGTKQWTRFWGSTDYDVGSGVTVDAAGNIYVAGKTDGSFDGQTNNGASDFCLTKFNSSGTKQWTRIWGSTEREWIGGLSIDSSGNVYVIGETWGSFDGQTNNGDYDLCLTKFNSSGTKQWTRIWGSTVLDYGWDVTVDATGNVYVVGRTEGSFDGQTNNGASDFCLTKFNSSGTKQWTRIWGSSSDDSGWGVSVDSSGNVYVAGCTRGSFDGQTNNGEYDLCLTKFNSSGTKLWTRIWGSTTFDFGGSVCVDNEGNLYVSGYTRGSFDGQTNNGGSDLCLTKFSDNNPPMQSSNISPVSGTIGISLTPMFHLSAFSDIDSNDYHAATTWQVSSVSNFQTIIWESICNTNALTTITIPPDILQPSTKYYWRARYQDQHGAWSAWSVPTWFETGSTSGNLPPSIPDNQSPTNGATGASLSPNLQASVFVDSDPEDTHAASQWQISAVSNFTGIAWDSGADIVHLTNLIVPGGYLGVSTRYFWRVRYLDSYGNWSEYSQPTSFRTRTEPNRPINMCPANGSVRVPLTQVLNATEFSDADPGDTHTASEWQLSTGWSSGEDGINLTNFPLSANVLTNGLFYYWRVRYKDSQANWSDWSNLTWFETEGNGISNTPPDAPTNLLPTNGTTKLSLTPQFDSSSFSDPDIGDVHDASQWQVSMYSDFRSITWDSGACMAELTSIVVPTGILSYKRSYHWRVRYRDNNDIWSDWSDATSFVAGGSAPDNVWILINNGAPYATSTYVRLTLHAEDETPIDMLIGNDPELVGSYWQTYESNVYWTLTEGDGNKKVYAQFKDIVENTSAVVSAGTILDTIPPSNIFLLINNGAIFTSNRIVLITNVAVDVEYLDIANTSTFMECMTTNYLERINWQISDVDDTNTVYVRYRDVAQNSYTTSAWVILDRIAPTGTYISINGGTPETTNPVVTLTLYATDPYLSTMIVGNDIDFTGSTWTDYTNNLEWTLSGDYGDVNTVYAKFHDQVGWESGVVSNSILLVPEPDFAVLLLVVTWFLNVKRRFK